MCQINTQSIDVSQHTAPFYDELNTILNDAKQKYVRDSSRPVYNSHPFGHH